MKIGVLGDLILNNNLQIDNRIVDILNSTDFNIANLEAPFIEYDWIKPNQKNGLFQLSQNCHLLKNLNIKVVSLANNHISDFGTHGIEKTLKILKNENILYFGAGLNENEAIKPAIIEVEGKKTAFFGFMMKYFSNKYFAAKTSSGIAKYNPEIVIPLLKNCNADYKIIYNHWNQEFEDYPEPVMRYYSEKIIEHCDVIIGSHPHCIQGIEKINGKPVFYSLGNFAMSNVKYGNISLPKYPEKCYKSFFIVLNIEKRKIDYEIFPISMNDDSTEIKLMKIDESKLIINKIENISEPFRLSYNKYKKFYNRNKIRKLRFTFTKYEKINSLLMFLSLTVLKIISIAQKIIFKILKLIKLDKFVQKKFSKTLAKVNNAK